MSLTAVTVLLLVAVGSAHSALNEESYQNQFVGFVKQFNKQYNAAEVFFRFNVFKDNLEFISQQNSLNKSFALGVNEFSDMTHKEFLSTLVGQRLKSAIGNDPEAVATVEPQTKAPRAEVDWRDKGCVTAVKNQGSCGSCWTFSSTGAMEAMHFFANGTLVDLSQQQLVDCAGPEGNHGCSGGLTYNAFKWVQKNGGICSLAGYPYVGRDMTCKKTCQPVAKVGGYVTVDKNENALKTSVDGRPTSISLDARGREWQSYKSGIFNVPSCGREMEHDVLAVGYSDSGNYWLVKNSWGTNWGERGYIRIVRGKNMCGLADDVYYPTAPK